MGWSGLERNKLDYILTDLLPVEISELFSFSQFYSFLLQKDQQKVIENLIQDIRENKAKSSSRMFENERNERYPTILCIESILVH